MSYGVDTILLVEIVMPTLRSSRFSEEENEAGHRCAFDLINETRDVST